MDIMSHLLNGYMKLFAFRGRATRTEFWALFAVNLFVLLGCLTLADALSGGAQTAFVAIGITAAILGNLASAARRLHDTNRSAVWLAATIVPIMPFVVLYFLTKPSVTGPTRFDNHYSMPDRTPDHYGRIQPQRLA